MNVATEGDFEELDPEEHAGVFAGKSMGGFRLLREIASGGMASVYLGHKSGPGGFGQVAAIKVVHPHLAKARDFVEMFLDEARIAATIDHPNVVRVLDFGRAEGTYYLAMEHLMGETWAEVRKRVVARSGGDDLQTLPLMLAHVLERSCEGLHAAHEAKDPGGKPLQIVHRDVSPHNLFVTYDGNVRVLDFGIASAAERLHTTRHGTVKGRFSYMSPEQMRAEALDRRSDVWSLGVILWEGLARRRLFQRDTEAETIAAVTQQPMPAFPADVQAPEALLEIAQKALQRDPVQRFDTARAMGMALARWLSQASPVIEVEVSTRMQRLFGPDIEAKERLRAEAARNAAADSQEAILPDDPADIDTVPPKRRSELQLTRALASAALAPTELSPLTPTKTAPLAANDGPPAARHPSRQILLGGAFVSCIVLATGWFAWSGSSREITLKPAPTLSTPRADGRATMAPEKPVPEPTERVPVVTAMTPEVVEPATKRIARGTLNVTAPGCWAYVYEGSTKLGMTPGSLRLSAGSHELRIEVLGKKPGLVRRVQVPAGGTARIKVPCK